jgi:benzoyl-CoA reductase subunit C
MTNPLFYDLIKRCETLYEDLSLGYVKEWKEKNKAKAIGFMPVYFPREIAYASGILPVGIMGGGDQIEIIKGDAYFQSYICHIPRSTIEMGLSGKLDNLDGMIFPSICDVIRNLSGMWKMLFKDKISIYFDLPQNFDENIGGKFYIHDLQQILDTFEGLSGIRATKKSLNKAIKLYNRNRNLIIQLYKHRSDKPWEIPTAELYLILRAGLILDVKEHNKLVEDYLSLVPYLGRKPMDNSRVIMSGLFCEQPPLAMIRALERSGCYIVDDDSILVTRWIKGDIPAGDMPVKEIAHAYISNSREGSFKYNPDTKGEELLKSFKENNADGVIFSAPSFCDPALLDRPMLQTVMEKNNIPYTNFKYAENTGQFQVIREQAGTFADSLKLMEA